MLTPSLLVATVSWLAAFVPPPEAPDGGRAAPPNPNSEWVNLTVPETIPVEGVIFVRAHYIASFEREAPPESLDGLIDIAVLDPADAGEGGPGIAGQTTYDEQREVALWTSDVPLEPDHAYAVKVTLRYHEDSERQDEHLLFASTLPGAWPAPARPAPPEQLDFSMACAEAGCCPAELAIQGRFASPDTALRAEFRHDGSSTWREENVTSSRFFYFVSHTYPTFGPEACYRLTAVSLVNGLESAVIHCLPNPAPSPSDADQTFDPGAGRRLPCVAVSDGLAPNSEAGCSGSGGAPPVWILFAVTLGGLAFRRRSPWRADPGPYDPAKCLV